MGTLEFCDDVILFLFFKMLMTGREADISGIDASKEVLCDRNVVEVSKNLLEELPGIIGRISDRLAVKLEERIIVTRTVTKISETTREGNLEVGTRQGKKVGM